MRKSTWTMVSILSGAIVYNEFEAFNNCPPAGDAICTEGGFGLSWIFFFVGLVVSITGVFLLSKRKSNEQPEKNFSIGKKKKPSKDKYAVAGTTDKQKPDVATGPETEEDEEEKEKTAVTDFSAFRDVLLAPLEGQRTPLSGVTLSVRVVVVEREDTSQRWPFTVLMVTDGAPARPPPPKRTICGPRKRKISFGAARTDAPEAQALTEVGADRTDDENDNDHDAEISDAVAVHLLDVVHSINGVSIWRPGALDLNSLHDQLRAPGAEISVRRIAKIKMDKFCEMPIQCGPKGTPSFSDRVASAVGRHMPWQLPVAALLKEPSFDKVYTAVSPETTATPPGVDMNVSTVGGLGKAGPRIVDDFKVAEKIVWRRQKLCGLCNYDGVVEPGPASELHAVTHSVETNRPTTFVLSVDDDVNEDVATSAFDQASGDDDDDDDFGDETGGIGIGSDSSSSGDDDN